jgi:hypothetical protein
LADKAQQIQNSVVAAMVASLSTADLNGVAQAMQSAATALEAML